MRKLLYNVVILLSAIQMTHAAITLSSGSLKHRPRPPFDKIKIEHRSPLTKESSKMEKEVQEIVNNLQPATFENTVVART